ncbi:MAG: alpha/beta hydrolase fold domain-containing protein [Paenibacillus sp.]|nr:alpha/beta hydrolase fold domain-containing protein [Paenibacillus sp.]
MVLAKQRNLENKIKYHILYYPTTDASLSSESYKQFADGYFLTKSLIEYFFKNYLSSDEDRKNKLALPVNAMVNDLFGLPAGLLITAEADVLRDGKTFPFFFWIQKKTTINIYKFMLV